MPGSACRMLGSVGTPLPPRTPARAGAPPPAASGAPVVVPRPLQNRVTPLGELVAVPAHGGLMGNRGRLHDGARRIVRRTAPGYRAWVTCRLEFKGRWRPVMRPGRYTELFFLDEATALAAGHRPCGECRREDHRRFKAAWLSGNRDRGLGPATPIAVLDVVLHGDRLDPAGRQRTFPGRIEDLPDGVFLMVPDSMPAALLLLWRGALRAWAPEGYGPAVPRALRGPVVVLTPHSTVAAIRAGYVPAVHPTAG